MMFRRPRPIAMGVTLFAGLLLGTFGHITTVSAATLLTLQAFDTESGTILGFDFDGTNLTSGSTTITASEGSLAGFDAIASTATNFFIFDRETGQIGKWDFDGTILSGGFTEISTGSFAGFEGIGVTSTHLYAFDNETGLISGFDFDGTTIDISSSTTISTGTFAGFDDIAVTPTHLYALDTETGLVSRFDFDGTTILLSSGLNLSASFSNFDGLAVAVPEPSSLLLAGMAVTGLGCLVLRRRRQWTARRKT